MLYDIVIEGIYTFTISLSGHLTTFHPRNREFELYLGRLGNFFCPTEYLWLFNHGGISRKRSRFREQMANQKGSSKALQYF